MGGRSRGSERRGIRLFLPGVAMGIGATLALAGCGMDIISGGGTEPTMRFKLTVAVTNPGTGSGRIDVTFPAGDVQDPCPELLGPGESCSPYVVRNQPTTSVDLDVLAVEGSRFVGWFGGECSGIDEECTVTTNANDPEVEISVEPRFDLVPGG